MSRSISIFVVSLLLACPAFANSVKRFDSRSAHPFFERDSHQAGFSDRDNRLWEIASSRKRFDFDDSEKTKVHFFHRSEREHCDRDPVVGPSVDPVVLSAVPEVPTAWLVLLGTLTLMGTARLRSVFARRS